MTIRRIYNLYGGAAICLSDTLCKSQEMRRDDVAPSRLYLDLENETMLWAGENCHNQL
ncbi:MAG: hypothetical protein NVS1B11_36760 [Terriglobales bacterium]